ncbi:methionyl-tRNA formyltransferase [Winogradskyella forsetii]|uniref:methionyl-tRNA formyltransferase n=1 Tax=Winogradskyella forsetii TaxID=2686077 RepID=UPI0015C017E3|nr:methionyl-tRNA formyltransferase [Winogradskyella forsetii]
MSTYVILSEKKWNQSIIETLQKETNSINWILINQKKDFNLGFLKEHNVTKIFIPHWSYIISEEIFTQYECVVFHMTDLPYGRGGSPLQNLIVRGHKETKISAIRVVKELDAGEIYLKENLSLSGTAEEIFIRGNKIIEQMILSIVLNNPEPKTQKGEIVKFKRRKPEDGNIENVENLEIVYDYIRMLDADGYPNAFIETKGLKLEFSKAQLNSNKETLTAYVRIVKK